MKINTYTLKSQKAGGLTLPRDFSEKENLSLLAQAIRVYEDGQHPRNAVVKTRADVAFSKKKIYKQKHTGRARHGARSAPIFVGGGVTHGPTGIKKDLGLPKAMRQKALKVAFSLKVKRGEVVAGDIAKITKTSQARGLVDSIIKKESEDKKTSVVLGVSKKNLGVMKFFRNLKDVKVLPYVDLNAYVVFLGSLIILDKDIFEIKVKGKK